MGSTSAEMQTAVIWTIIYPSSQFPTPFISTQKPSGITLDVGVQAVRDFRVWLSD